MLLQKGETWATPNCSEATCEGNNVISLRPRTCPRVEKPTCANGYPAVKVADQDGCCHHYQCQCEWSAEREPGQPGQPLPTQVEMGGAEEGAWLKQKRIGWDSRNDFPASRRGRMGPSLPPLGVLSESL